MTNLRALAIIVVAIALFAFVAIAVVTHPAIHEALTRVERTR